MVGRKYRAIECLKYFNARQPYPVLKFKLVNLAREEYPEELIAPVDTGFEGCLLVTREIYDFVKVGELPKSSWGVYRTLAGTTTMRSARAFIVVGDQKLPVIVETPYFGLGKLLIGRCVLNRLILILDGVSKETCLAEPLS